MEELESRQLLSLLPVATTASIGVLQDELAFFSPGPEVTFAATHSVGTQKLTTDLNQFYTSLNPNWYLLHYQLGTEEAKYYYIINNAWGQDFDPGRMGFINDPAAGPGGTISHDDWFEHSNGSLDPTTTGNHIISPDFLHLMNIDSDGWRAYRAASMVQNMVATGASATFADSFEGPTFGYFVNQGDARFDFSGPIPGPANPAVWPNGETWLVKAANYVAWIQGQLTAAGEALNGPGGGFVYIPNVGPMYTGWADIDYSASKGLFAEGFAVVGGLITDGDWIMSMNRALRITSTSNPANADRMFIMQPDLSQVPDSPQGLQERSWAFGSYLLLKGDHTYINMYGAVTDSRLMWYPEYQVNLGAAQDPGGMPLTVDGYYDPNSQLYIRYYENGIVLVNNSATSLAYTPPQAMQQVIVSGYGGGVRPGDIDPTTNSYVAGWLSSQMVDTATVGPYSSVILIYPGIPIEVPPPGGSASLFTPMGDYGLADLGLPTVLTVSIGWFVVRRRRLAREVRRQCQVELPVCG